MSLKSTVVLWTVSACLLAHLSVARLYAQGATATVSGTVTDSSGAAIPEAAISVRNTGTGVTRPLVSDGQGHYNVPDLPIGNYDIQAVKPGFQTVVRRDVTTSSLAATTRLDPAW
jgi:hypothetical protein